MASLVSWNNGPARRVGLGHPDGLLDPPQLLVGADDLSIARHDSRCGSNVDHPTRPIVKEVNVTHEISGGDKDVERLVAPHSATAT